MAGAPALIGERWMTAAPLRLRSISSQSMSANEKSLYVRTLLGHEKTKEAKGGNDRVFTQSIDEYVKGVDDAYARGDTRTVDAIFESMGKPR